MTLEEAVRVALSNSQVIRRDADFVSVSSQTLVAPGQASTTLAPSIADAGFLFGQHGEAAALSDFDAQLNFRTTWSRNEAIQNNLFLSGGILPGGALVEDTAESVLEIVRDNRSGGRTRLYHTVSYDASNRQDLLFPSAYRLALGAEFRQPLLAGAGRLYTDVAGPPGDLLRGVTGVSQGILIARNQTKQARLQLQSDVTAFLLDIETVYWDLRAATESIECVRETKSELTEYAKMLEARIDALANVSELERLTISDLQLSLQQLEYEQRQRKRSASSRLNRMLGMSSESGGTWEPANGFFEATLVVDRESARPLAIQRRAEVRQQRLRIESIDLQIRAAQSLLLPQLDGIARYQVNGFGDSLARETVPGPDEFIQSAYKNLSEGDFTGWELGFQFSHRFGRRLERTRIRNLRLQAQRERIVLKEQQEEIGHEIEAVLDRIEDTIRQRDLLQERMEVLTNRSYLLQVRHEANDPQVTIEQLVSAILAINTVKLEWINRRAQYSQLIAKLQSIIGSSLHENNVLIQEPTISSLDPQDSTIAQ